LFADEPDLPKGKMPNDLYGLIRKWLRVRRYLSKETGQTTEKEFRKEAL
jgi:hypothetical protein